MKYIAYIIYRLFIKDFQSKIESARTTVDMIEASTTGKIGHFYNHQGDKIRGFYRPIKFTAAQHPLIVKYGSN